MGVDHALSRLGKYGKWQMIKYTLICLSVTVSGCWHMMVSVFTGGEPDHHCVVPAGQLVNETIPMEINLGKERYSRCEQYVNYSVSNATTSCADGWQYADEYETTIVTEWDLVCSKNYLAETSQSVFNFGVMVGAVVFTTLADKLGRKPVHLGCQYAMIVVGLAIAFSPDYITFVVLRFLLGAIREGAGLVGIVMACELFPADQRTFAGAALELYWAAAWMVLALLAYLVTNWRHLQLTVTIPPVISVALIWLLPESIPWLVANGRVDQAEDIMKEAARFNGVTLPHKIFGAVDTESDSFDALTTNTETHHTHPDSQTKILNHKDKEALLDENIPVDTTHGEKTQDQEQGQYQVGLMTDNKSDMADQLVTKDDKSSIDTDATVHDMADSAFADDETDDHTDTSMDERLEMNKGAKTMKPLLMDDSRDDANQVTIVPRKPHRRLQNICGRICNKKRSPVQDEYAIAQYTCLDILRSRTMVLYSFIMCSVWFASGFIYFGLSLGTATMPGGKYINFFLSGAVEAPAYGMTVIVLQKYGRRWPLFIFHMVAALVLFINVFLPEVTESGVNLIPLVVTLSMIGKFAMTAAFGTVVLYAPEIYPTNLRNLGFGLASVWGRIGGMIAPFAVYIGKIVPWIPGLVFSIIAVVTGLGVFFLPETLNRPLPDTIEEIESWNRSGGYKTPKTEQHNRSKGLKKYFIRDKNHKKSQNETNL